MFGLGTVLGLLGGPVGALAGTAIQAGGALLAGHQQASAAARDRAYQMRATAPWRRGGIGAQNALSYELGVGAKPANYGGFQKTQDYTFGLNQGIDAVQASAAARGGLYSGQTLQALNQWGQDYGSGRRDTYLNRLAALSGQGLNAAQGTAAAVSSANAGQANANSAGIIGFGNALNEGINGLTGINGYQKALAQNPLRTIY